jgi:hypothetical protein
MKPWQPRAANAVRALILVAAVVVPAAADRQTFTENGTGSFDRVAAAAVRAALHDRLVATRVEAGLATPLRVDPLPAALAAVAADQGPRRMVGAVVPVSVQADFAGAGGLGAVRRDPDGWVWTGRVESPGATAVRLRFDDLYLPRGAELFLYTDDGEVKGPYSSRGGRRDGSFLSHTVLGSAVTLQVSYAGQDGPRALGAARLSVGGVGHLTERFTFGALHAVGVGEALCNFNEDCVENAECSNIPSAIAQAQDAVGHMLFQSGAFLYICTGGLLADADAGSQIPYFLTANHCIS